MGVVSLLAETVTGEVTIVTVQMSSSRFGKSSVTV